MFLRASIRTFSVTGKRCPVSYLSSSSWSTSSVLKGRGILETTLKLKSGGPTTRIMTNRSNSPTEMTKVVQGHNHVCARSFRATVSVDQKQQDDTFQGHEDPALPNETWTAESIALFDKLVQETRESPDDWRRMPSPPAEGEVRLFLRNVPEHGKVFEYAMFLNKKGRQLKGVVQFGPYTQGPPGHVHGGAIASILDSAIGVCSFKSVGPCVTANLNINYKRGIPLGTTAYGEARVDRLDGRKMFGSGELKSPDGKIVYAEATALFILVNREPVTSEEVADY